jgi:hypothetical protein
VDLVAAAGEGGQHRAGLIVIARLSQRTAVEVDDRIRADRQVRREPGTFGFTARVNEGRLDWGAARQRGLVIRRRDDVDIETKR